MSFVVCFLICLAGLFRSAGSLLVGASFRRGLPGPRASNATPTPRDPVFAARDPRAPKPRMRAHEAQEVRRADSLLEDVRNAEGRAERLYQAAEAILARALT